LINNKGNDFYGLCCPGADTIKTLKISGSIVEVMKRALFLSHMLKEENTVSLSELKTVISGKICCDLLKCPKAQERAFGNRSFRFCDPTLGK